MGQRYPAVIRLWDNAWTEFIPFLDYGACRRITGWTTGSRRPRDPGLAPMARSSARRGLAVGSGDPSAVDLAEVERGGRQVQFAGRVVQAAA